MLTVSNPLNGGLTIKPSPPAAVILPPIAKPSPPSPSESKYSRISLLKEINSAPSAPKKNGKHLILDLDETLVHSFSPGDNLQNFIADLTDDQKKRIYNLKFQNGESLQGYIRPGAEEFLRVAFQEFESVGVWSAGTKEYVHLIVDTVFKEQRPIFILSRDQCNELRIRDETMPCRYKPLDVVYQRYPDHNEANTVIVDDRHDICALNCMNNIRIPEFQMDAGNFDTMTEDTTLLILAKWFQTPLFRSAADFRDIKGKSPFKI